MFVFVSRGARRMLTLLAALGLVIGLTGLAPTSAQAAPLSRQLGWTATFPHFNVTVGNVVYSPAHGTLVYTLVCVRSLPPGSTGGRTRISWDPWRLTTTSGTVAPRVYDASHPPEGMFPRVRVLPSRGLRRRLGSVRGRQRRGDQDQLLQQSGQPGDVVRAAENPQHQPRRDPDLLALLGHGPADDRGRGPVLGGSAGQGMRPLGERLPRRCADHPDAVDVEHEPRDLHHDDHAGGVPGLRAGVPLEHPPRRR